MVETKNPYGVCGWAIMLALLSFGCSSTDHMNSVTTCDVRAYNRSSKDIRFVVIDPNGTKTRIGFLASGAPEKFACMLFSSVRFARDFTVTWQEDNVKRETPIDIMKFDQKRTTIKSFNFIYMGNGEWKVIARSGTDEASPEVKP